MKISKNVIRAIAIAVFLIVMIGIALHIFYTNRGSSSASIFLSAALVATAVITFFGFLWGGIGEDNSLSPDVMRMAITVSVVTVYLVLMGLVAFFSLPQGTPGQPITNELPAITQTMLTSFTAIVAIIVPFYFGTTAFLQAKLAEIKQRDDASKDP
jgi:hypothetical protein